MPAPPEAEVPPAPAPLPEDPAVPLPDADAPPEAAEPLPAEDGAALVAGAVLVVLGVDDVVEVVVLGTVAALADAPVGTVRGGAPEVLAELEPPPPQALRPVARASAVATMATARWPERDGTPERRGASA